MTTERPASPAGNQPAPDGYESWDDYMLEEEHRVRAEQAWRNDIEPRRGIKAMRLAPDLAVYRALIANQPVPVAALSSDWAHRYGLTTRTAS